MAWSASSMTITTKLGFAERRYPDRCARFAATEPLTANPRSAAIVANSPSLTYRCCIAAVYNERKTPATAHWFAAILLAGETEDKSKNPSIPLSLAVWQSAASESTQFFEFLGNALKD